jgi:pimeloyl-ACP methyl ester carboxylesterase
MRWCLAPLLKSNDGGRYGHFPWSAAQIMTVHRQRFIATADQSEVGGGSPSLLYLLVAQDQFGARACTSRSGKGATLEWRGMPPAWPASSTLGVEFAIPMFFIEGSEDYMTPVEPAERYFRQIVPPLKDFVQLPGGDHFIPFDRPDECLAELVARVRPFANPLSDRSSSN